MVDLISQSLLHRIDDPGQASDRPPEVFARLDPKHQLRRAAFTVFAVVGVFPEGGIGPRALPGRGRSWRRVLKTFPPLWPLSCRSASLSTLNPPNNSILFQRGERFSLSLGAHLYPYLFRWTPWVSKPPSLRPNGPSEPSRSLSQAMSLLPSAREPVDALHA